MKNNNSGNDSNSNSVPVAGGASPLAFGTMKYKAHHRLFISLAVIAAVILVALGAYLYQNHHQAKYTYNSSNVRTIPAAYSASELTAYSLLGSAVGQGMSFKLPSSFDKQPEKPPSSVHLFFTQLAGGSTPLTIGQADASSVRYINNQGPTDADLASFDVGIKDPASAVYAQQIFLAKSFIHSRFNKLSADTIALKPFTSSNIAGHSWIADYTTPKVSATSKRPIPYYQGQLVYVLSKNASYYFLISTLSDNWQSNTAVWAQVLDSLKIDQ